MAPVIQAERLSKTYRLYERPHVALADLFGLTRRSHSVRRVTALDEVTFDLPQGASIGVVGRNGSGKSTLLRILAGITTPSSGRVQVLGARSSFVGLGVGFEPALSGRRNIALHARLAGFSKHEIATATPNILTFAELGADIDRPLRTYSSGMRMRLAFSIAIEMAEDLLLLDEVLAVGDNYFQTRCLERIKAFKSRGGSLVFVSHDLGTVRSVCEYALWLDGGKRRACGEAWSVVRSYANFVRGLTGAPEATPEPEQGSGELRITGLDLLDSRGVCCSTFHPSDFVIARLHYHASRMIERPNFGLAIYRNDGLLCFGTSSAKEGMAIDKVQGGGYLEVRFSPLGLLGGSYDITVAAFDEQDIYKYHYAHRKYGFRVEQDSCDEGVFRPQVEFRPPVA